MHYFLYALRAAKIPVGTNEWLALMEALVQDQSNSSLDTFYYLARSVLVKSESLYDAYDAAFLACFHEKTGDIKIKSEILDWLNKSLDGRQRPPIPDIPKLALDELRKKLRERLAEQNEEHHGGNYWIGTGGTSPFGHSGSHPSGVRIGGPGGGRMAVKVAEERRFANYRHDKMLDTRQFQVALKRLRKLEKMGPAVNLNMDQSIRETCKNAGEIELVFEADKKNRTELLLIMDVGGSMDPYIQLMDSLFSAAHSLKHYKAFHHFYFHNCVYSKLFTDINRNQSISTAEVFKKFGKTYKVIYVGDACMNPYELFSPGGAIDYWENNPTTGIDWLRRLKEHFPRSVWLNPEPEHVWEHVTIQSIKKLFKMYPLTVEGLGKAVDNLRKESVQ